MEVDLQDSTFWS